MVAVRRRDQHADTAEACRQRTEIFTVAHDRPVLADSIDVSHGPQSSCEPLRVDHGSRRRVPRCGGSPARRVRHYRPGAPGQWLQHLLAGKEPQRSDRGHRERRQPVRVAAAEGLRSVLRVPRRRDQQLVPGPGRRQQVHRSTLHAGPGLPPVEGPRRSGDQDAAGSEVHESIEAVVHVVLSGGESRAAPQPEGVRRQVQGQVRRRVRGVSRVGTAENDRERDPAERHNADANQSDAGGRGRHGAR